MRYIFKYWVIERRMGWSEWPSWVKGGVIFSLISIIILILGKITHDYYTNLILLGIMTYPVILIVELVSNLFLKDLQVYDKIRAPFFIWGYNTINDYTLLTYILSILLWFLIGALIGFIVGKIKGLLFNK